MMSELDSITKRQRDIEGELLSFAAMTHELAEECNPLLAYKAVNPDILRLHEAMKVKDQKEFKTAMEKEVNDQIANGIFTVIPRSKVPKGFCIFPGVWTLVHKRDIQTHEIKKYKARLALDGSRMREGEDYDKTYAPVASWMSIRLLLTFVVAFGWHTQQVDYIATYTQAPIDRDMYMEFPRRFIPSQLLSPYCSWDAGSLRSTPMDQNHPFDLAEHPCLGLPPLCAGANLPRCNREKSKGTQQGHKLSHNDGTRLFSGFLVSFASGVVKRNCWMKQQSNTQKQGHL